MPTFNNIEDVKLYGPPAVVEIDGVPLSKLQATKVLPGIVDRLMDEAGYEKEEAWRRAVDAFKAMYDRKDGRWESKKRIVLKGHGGVVRNKYHEADKRERDMARGKGKPVTERSPAERLIETLMEAGARNNRKDKAAIKEVVRLALSQLSKEDGLQALKELGLRVKEEKK